MVGVEKETTQTLSSVPTHVPSPAQALAIKGAAIAERRTRVTYKMGGVAPPQEFFAPAEKQIIVGKEPKEVSKAEAAVSLISKYPKARGISAAISPQGLLEVTRAGRKRIYGQYVPKKGGFPFTGVVADIPVTAKYQRGFEKYLGTGRPPKKPDKTIYGMLAKEVRAEKEERIAAERERYGLPIFRSKWVEQKLFKPVAEQFKKRGVTIELAGRLVGEQATPYYYPKKIREKIVKAKAEFAIGLYEELRYKPVQTVLTVGAGKLLKVGQLGIRAAARAVPTFKTLPFITTAKALTKAERIGTPIIAGAYGVGVGAEATWAEITGKRGGAARALGKEVVRGGAFFLGAGGVLKAEPAKKLYKVKKLIKAEVSIGIEVEGGRRTLIEQVKPTIETADVLRTTRPKIRKTVLLKTEAKMPSLTQKKIAPAISIAQRYGLDIKMGIRPKGGLDIRAVTALGKVPVGKREFVLSEEPLSIFGLKAERYVPSRELIAVKGYKRTITKEGEVVGVFGFAEARPFEYKSIWMADIKKPSITKQIDIEPSFRTRKITIGADLLKRKKFLGVIGGLEKPKAAFPFKPFVEEITYTKLVPYTRKYEVKQPKPFKVAKKEKPVKFDISKLPEARRKAFESIKKDIPFKAPLVEKEVSIGGQKLKLKVKSEAVTKKELKRKVKPVVAVEAPLKTRFAEAVEMVGITALPKIGTITDIKTITKVKPILETKVITEVKPITKVKPILETKTILETRVIQRSAIKQILDVGVIQTQMLKPRLALKQKLDVRPVFDIPKTVTTTTPPPPIIPPIGLFRPDVRRKKKRGKPIPSAFAPAYTPTVEAILLGITGKKPPKALVRTGLGLRPLLR